MVASSQAPLREQDRRLESAVDERQCATRSLRLKPRTVLKEARREIAKGIRSPSSVCLEKSSNRLDIVHWRHRLDDYISAIIEMDD